MTPQQFLLTLQLNDTLFPTGGFAYSDGLEAAIGAGLVKDAAALQSWLDHYIDSVFPSSDGLALRKAMVGHAESNWPVLRALDAECTALKPAATVRASSVSLGKRFLNSVASPHAHADFDRLAAEIDTGALAGNLPVVYGVTFSILGFQPRDALLAFGYARLAGMISAALRLMPIGQQQGQLILSRALERLPDGVERILIAGDAELTSFSPLLDVQQMNHRYLYSRLFRS